MAAKRVVALLAAALLIVGAVLIRRTIDHRGASAGDTTSVDATREQAVTCVEDLTELCATLRVKGLTVKVEPLTTTLDAIAAGAGPTAWVTFAPIDQLAVGPDGTVAYGAAVPLASTRLSLATRAERADVLAAACGGAITWTCIGKRSGDAWTALGGEASWGNLAPGHDNPSRRALGLLAMGSASASYFGSTTFNAVDLDADPGFFGWFSRLERGIPAFVPNAATALDPLATGRAVDSVGSTEAAVTGVAAAPASRFIVTYPDPVGRADAVLVIANGSSLPSRVGSDLSSALLATPGWTPTPSEPTGIPSAGVLRSLLDLWTTLR
ncbi:MAG: hypothetical protein RJA49_2231 [Actinomycetota bacterium]|jgi:hypothetical protein